MSYVKGEVRVYAPSACPGIESEGWCECEPPVEEHRKPYHLDGPGAYLPHSCDEWVIGGPDEIRAMIEDLRAALSELERFDVSPPDR